jgi:hypothetical protein
VPQCDAGSSNTATIRHASHPSALPKLLHKPWTWRIILHIAKMVEGENYPNCDKRCNDPEMYLIEIIGNMAKMANSQWPTRIVSFWLYQLTLRSIKFFKGVKHAS